MECSKVQFFFTTGPAYIPSPVSEWSLVGLISHEVGSDP